MKKEFWVRDNHKDFGVPLTMTEFGFVAFQSPHNIEGNLLHVIDMGSYLELKSHADNMAEAISDIPVKGFAKALHRAEEYREWCGK